MTVKRPFFTLHPIKRAKGRAVIDTQRIFDKKIGQKLVEIQWNPNPIDSEDFNKGFRYGLLLAQAFAGTSKNTFIFGMERNIIKTIKILGKGYTI